MSLLCERDSYHSLSRKAFRWSETLAIINFLLKHLPLVVVINLEKVFILERRSE